MYTPYEVRQEIKLPPIWERVVNSACQHVSLLDAHVTLLVLLFNCLCRSVFPFDVENLMWISVISVPEFTFFSFTLVVHEYSDDK